MQLERDRVLAVDIGTSSVRAMVFDASGAIHSRTQIGYPTVRPQPFYEEQDPELVRRETYRAISECLKESSAGPERIGGIGFSSQMYGIFPVDEDGQPLTFNILWSDGRAEKQAAALKGGQGRGPLYDMTGCPANSIYPVSKLAWLRAERKEIFDRAARFVSIKEFVIRSLVGEWVVDHSMASATGLFDISGRRWHPAALEFAGIGAERLSRPVAGDAGLPFANADLRKAWGLPEGVLVFSGGGDGPLANVGSGAFEVGAVNVDLGTSGAARVVVDKPTTDNNGSLWCYCLSSDRWTYGGIVTNVGNAYQWLGSNIVSYGRCDKSGDVFALMDAYASAVAPGSEGLFFLPYLRKARSPYWDDRLTGTVYGLGPDHDLRHLCRAALEAIAYDIAAIADLMAARVPLKSSIIMTGGLSKNAFIAKLFSDVLDREILVPENNEGSIAGSAVMALRGLGIVDGLSFDGQTERRYESYRPDPARAAAYRLLKADYAELVSRFRMLGAPLRGGAASTGAVALNGAVAPNGAAR